jgi:hypothetical protein
MGNDFILQDEVTSMNFTKNAVCLSGAYEPIVWKHISKYQRNRKNMRIYSII